jgi:hypothetical protein
MIGLLKISLNIIGYYKLKKDKLEKLREEASFKLRCPFVNCLKNFNETGNLKTHLRTHVSLLTYCYLNQ